MNRERRPRDGPPSEGPRTTPEPAVTPMKEIGPGDRLENYHIIKQLGRGGMGTVYSAHDTLLRRAVAIKVLSRQGGDDAELARLLREAQAIARLDHPHIVRI